MVEFLQNALLVITGMFIGAPFGMFVLALCVSASLGDEQLRRDDTHNDKL